MPKPPRKALSETSKILTAFGKDDLAIDFKMEDIKGNKHALSQYKGKLIIINLWATWCKPCLEKMPKFEQLKTKFKNIPDIVFISLCVYDDKNRWINYFSNHSTDINQFFIGRGQAEEYRILGIPRTIYIDKDFKIAKMEGPLPGESGIESYIDDLFRANKHRGNQDN